MTGCGATISDLGDRGTETELSGVSLTGSITVHLSIKIGIARQDSAQFCQVLV